MREQRKLAVILAADVVGYSRLMGRDEAGTLARLKEHWAQRLEPALARYGGRLVKLTGDGVLAEFPSAVDALRAAIEFQQAVYGANAKQHEDHRITFRVGLHLGDMIVDGDDLYGDAVNIAARLEGEAAPGGIVVSGALHEATAGKLQAEFVDLGRLPLKNIERPVQAYRIEWGQRQQPPTATTASTSSTTTLGPDKPSIAVLPFLCPGGSPEYEAFADGITESLITDLSRQRGLDVVARTTSFSLKGNAMDVREVGRELKGRYVLEGSVQAGNRRLRVNVQLISASTGIHVWADRFDRELGDLLDLQDEIVERISRVLAVQLREAEIRRGIEQHQRAPSAETLALLGRRALLQGFCRKNCAQAASLHEQALLVDNRNAAAHTALSIIKSMFYVFRWGDTRDADLDAAVRHRDHAVSLDPNSPYAQVASAWIPFAERKYTAALAAFEKIAQAAPLAGAMPLPILR